MLDRQRQVIAEKVDRIGTTIHATRPNPKPSPLPWGNQKESGPGLYPLTPSGIWGLRDRKNLPHEYLFAHTGERARPGPISWYNLGALEVTILTDEPVSLGYGGQFAYCLLGRLSLRLELCRGLAEAEKNEGQSAIHSLLSTWFY